MSKKVEVRFLSSELRAASDSRTITGKAVVFNSLSEPLGGYFREKIDSKAFDECDMADVIFCFNHDVNTILGRTSSSTLKLEVRDDGLYFECELPETTQGNDLLALMRRGDISQCSFRFIIEEDSWRQKTPDNGLQYHERTILKISKLIDVSLVVFPAYADTEASVRSIQESFDQFIGKHDNEPEAKLNKVAQRSRAFKFLTLK